jgi:hypothetical protein
MRLLKQDNTTDFFSDASVKLVPDEELEQLAEEAGPSSAAAAMLRELKQYRAKDRQVFAFHINEHFFVGPVPDARTEADLLAIAELTKLAS